MNEPATSSRMNNFLRRRIQQTIDQRFFRSRYDAEHALARFSQNLRNQVDLPAIEHELVMVVKETLQPDAVSLWLQKSVSRSSSSAPIELEG